MARAPLGRATGHPDHYAPSQLFAIARAPQRAALNIADALPFDGADVWTAYELTWLDARGKPRVAIGRLEVPAASPSIVESKSMKLYLGSFAMTRFASDGEVRTAIARDLSRACGARVGVILRDASSFTQEAIHELDGVSLDDLDVSCDAYEIDASSLTACGDTVDETLVTHLFRSVCPVTTQPDIGSVQIGYHGPRIDRAGLLRYLVSCRCHAGFHEHCVERIFTDIAARCRPRSLTVHARFLRRGGIDINPFRTNAGTPIPDNVRTARQ
ncbi:MAG TPA: NADPH-dependent 7-cyano-7-deazaguanine reductase QueF [Casimicrobiaceae bacterium]|nr:NADPH-dependent 7-cyano-7-deazaguanine reductase QueF [Casimicrobiaceae bacterium]